MDKAIEREVRLGHPIPESMEIGNAGNTVIGVCAKAVLRNGRFLSIGGNDLKQFFFAADRENELVRDAMIP